MKTASMAPQEDRITLIDFQAPKTIGFVPVPGELETRLYVVLENDWINVVDMSANAYWHRRDRYPVGLGDTVIREATCYVADGGGVFVGVFDTIYDVVHFILDMDGVILFALDHELNDITAEIGD